MATRLINPNSDRDVTREQAFGEGRAGGPDYQLSPSEYFLRRREALPVAATTTTKSGQVLDWIPIESQHPQGEIASPPPTPVIASGPADERADQLCTFELQDSADAVGPAGTVPVLRKDLSALHDDDSLQRYLSKSRGAARYLVHLDGAMIALAEAAGSHHYGRSSHEAMIWGSDGYISAFDPYTETDMDMSLMQLSMHNDDLGFRQTVEAGWQQLHNLYGDWGPHLFTYYTTNGYGQSGDRKGGYNRDVEGWVQYDQSLYPGAVSSPNSVRGGAQYVLHLRYQWYNDNWWLMVNGKWIGYYPSKLFFPGGGSTFTSLGDHAGGVAWYGEIFDSNDVPGPTKSDMGSGYFAEAGWTWSAYQRNLLVQTDRGGTMADYDGGSGWASDPTLYDIQTQMRSGSSWGSYQWVGGPGAG